MTETKKTELSAFFTKDKKRDGFRKIIEDYILWQLSVLPDPALADTTADEIINGVHDVKKICDAVTAEARKQKNGSYTAMASWDVFWIVCKELHIDGVMKKEDTLGFVPEGFGKSVVTEVYAPAPPEPALHANAESSPFSVDIDSLFDD